MNTEPAQKTLADYLGALRRYRGRMLGVVVVLLVASLGVAFGLPPVYRSSATILIEQQEIPQDLVRSTITSFADQRIQVISQRVMTRANLTDIVKKFDLYADERKTEPMEVIIEQMRKDIAMDTISAEVVDPRSGRPTVATIAFRLSYESVSPALAQKVTNELVSLYLNENIRNRATSANETSGFLTSEVDRLAGRISETERALAAFKSEHVDELPELAQLNLQLLDRTERELLDAEREMRALRERKAYLETQIALVSESTSLYAQSGERILGAADRLKQLQTKYVGLVANYGPEHPDVVRAQKEIAALKKETGIVDTGSSLRDRREILAGELDVASRKYEAEHPDVRKLRREIAALDATIAVESEGAATRAETPDNPAYIQLQAQIESVQIELAALSAKKLELTEKRRLYEQRIARMPQVEREYRELMRDYDNAAVKYRELKAKQMEAQLAQVMETERRGERFTLIEPPELPEKPLKPNRSAILVLGTVFSLAGGVGTAAMSESLDATVRGVRGVTALLAMPPLAAIPYMETTAERRRRRLKMAAAIGTGLTILIGAVAAFHFFHMPLDVLWYVVQRRLGIQ